MTKINFRCEKRVPYPSHKESLVVAESRVAIRRGKCVFALEDGVMSAVTPLTRGEMRKYDLWGSGFEVKWNRVDKTPLQLL